MKTYVVGIHKKHLSTLVRHFYEYPQLGDNCIQICKSVVLQSEILFYGNVSAVYLPKWQIWMQLSPF